MHYIGEFLDLDATSFTNIAEFIALIQAIREGLGRIDSGFAVSDFHINLLFLSKLEAHPDWNNWARCMLRDHRISVSDYSAESMPFHLLAEMAIQHDREMKSQAAAAKKKQQDRIRETQRQDNSNRSNNNNNSRLEGFTQEEINSFVVRQMRMAQQQQQSSTTTHKSRGHSKRPSQEEINEFVVRQMHEEQERNTRATKPTAVVPRANFVGKKVEFRAQTPGGFPVYHTSFALT
jgi:hypothetical protein